MVSDPIFQIAGGVMTQIGSNPMLLVFGNDFEGAYRFPPVIQIYNEQVRRFHVHDDGVNLSFTPLSPLPLQPDPNFRRRDLNVVPVIHKQRHCLIPSIVALSGVFTLTDGAWTVPVEITANGVPSMADPALPATFKQGMNNYECATIGLFSEKTGDMYTLLMGGISFGYFEKENGREEFKTEAGLPFIGQTTVLKIDQKGRYSQYFLKKGGFPLIRSTGANPGNPLLFGSDADVKLVSCIPKYSNEVLKLDCIKKPTLVGYIVGGIQSTLPMTGPISDTTASAYIFKVIVEPARSEVYLFRPFCR